MDGAVKMEILVGIVVALITCHGLVSADEPERSSDYPNPFQDDPFDEPFMKLCENVTQESDPEYGVCKGTYKDALEDARRRGFSVIVRLLSSPRYSERERGLQEYSHIVAQEQAAEKRARAVGGSLKFG